MALNKQIWLNTIQDNFFPDDSFASKSVDDSAFVTNKTVHVPNAGEPSGVQTNRSTLPAESAAKRVDNELTYDVDELTTNPVYIPNVETVELSYDKRMSVLSNDRQQLQKEAAQNLLYRWMPTTVSKYIKTTGIAAPAHTSSDATGTRLKITKDDVLSISTRFNEDDVPMVGRTLLLDPRMYNDLINNLTDKELPAFLASADVQKGIMGNLYGFDVIQRSKVLRLTAAGALLKWDATNQATEVAAALAWQQDCVSRAIGDLKMFDRMDDPLYYGDIYSFLMRVGGAQRRYDNKGVCVLMENTPA
jgi:hypothetical protein